MKTNQSFKKDENSFLTSGGGLQLVKNFRHHIIKIRIFSINYEFTTKFHSIDIVFDVDDISGVLIDWTTERSPTTELSNLGTLALRQGKDDQVPQIDALDFCLAPAQVIKVENKLKLKLMLQDFNHSSISGREYEDGLVAFWLTPVQSK